MLIRFIRYMCSISIVMGTRVSFGIEFEFDVISRDARTIREEFPPGRRCTGSWDYQCDSTCAVELRSPVWDSLDDALYDIRDQFCYWCSELKNLAPYPMSEESRSLGMHIHIGLPQRRLLSWEKHIIARAGATVYPLLAAFSCQPIPSQRGLSNAYAKPIWSYDWRIPADDHYCEISDSHHGTVEFRLFDANIPQVGLVNAWLLKTVSEKVLSSDAARIKLFKNKYVRDRYLSLRYGVNALRIKSYLTHVNNIVGDIELPNYPFMRELLYLIVKYGLEPYSILKLSRVDRYQYFRSMFCNPYELVQNILPLTHSNVNRQLVSMLEDALENAQNLGKLSDLIALARDRKTIPIIQEYEEDMPARQWVKKCIENNSFRISRIGEVETMSSYDAAERISYLLVFHGGKNVNWISPRRIIEDPRRFYVFLVRDPQGAKETIIAAVAIRVSTGEISSLVVDRRYRRLGIASRLIEFVRGIAQKPVYGYVRMNNLPMLALLKKMGFEIKQFNNKVLLFHMPNDSPLSRVDE